MQVNMNDFIMFHVNRLSQMNTQVGHDTYEIRYDSCSFDIDREHSLGCLIASPMIDRFHHLHSKSLQCAFLEIEAIGMFS